MKYFLTFGQDHPLRNGWIEIETWAYGIARTLAFQFFGKHWAHVYKEEDFEKGLYPSGKIGEILRGE